MTWGDSAWLGAAFLVVAVLATGFIWWFERMGRR